MSGRTSRSGQQQAYTTVTGRQRPQKLSVFSTLKSALLCSNVKKDTVIEPKRLQNQSELEEISVPNTLDERAEQQNQSPAGDRQFSHDSDLEDDISVISLGEVRRRLAQQKINTVGLSTTLATPSHSAKPAAAPTKRTLPPIEPVYQQKAESALRKALRHRKVTNSESSDASNNEQSKQQNEAEKEAKEIPSEKREKLTCWMEETKRQEDSLFTVSTSSNTNKKLLAKEQAKVADLHKRISKMEQKQIIKQQQITQLMEKEGQDLWHEITKLVKSLRKAERKNKKLKAKVLTKEEKVKQLMITQSCSIIGEDLGSINTSGQARSENRTVSNTNTAASTSGNKGAIITTVGHKSKVDYVTLLPTCPTALDRNTVDSKKKDTLVQNVREGMLERPRAAHPSRIRSLTENIQVFLPYDLGHFDSDSEDEDQPRRYSYVAGAEGWREFEELQNANKYTRPGLDLGFESDDELDFLQYTSEEGTPCIRPPTRCRNPVAKQMLHMQQMGNHYPGIPMH